MRKSESISHTALGTVRSQLHILYTPCHLQKVLKQKDKNKQWEIIPRITKRINCFNRTIK